MAVGRLQAAFERFANRCRFLFRTPGAQLDALFVERSCTGRGYEGFPPQLEAHIDAYLRRHRHEIDRQLYALTRVEPSRTGNTPARGASG